MGGGGGRRRRELTPETLRELETLAKEKLKNAGQPEKRNVFLSFAQEDLDRVNLLRGQARNENSNISFNDYSLKEPFDSEKADYIKRGIRERIRQSSVTIVFLSEHSATSRWVNWEIEESLALGKGVVAMYAGDSPPALLPQALKGSKVSVVQWNQKELARAIEREARG
jgi:antiphage defense system Thoeris ThsB-like protein